jgi:hypothetical protein
MNIFNNSDTCIKIAYYAVISIIILMVIKYFITKNKIEKFANAESVGIVERPQFNKSEKLFGIIPPLEYIIQQLDNNLQRFKNQTDKPTDKEIEQKEVCINFQKEIARQIFNPDNKIHNATEDMVKLRPWLMQNLNTLFPDSADQEKIREGINLPDEYLATINEIITGCNFGIPK